MNRAEKIIEMIFLGENKITTKTLANYFSLSERTIRSDLTAVEKELNENNLRLIRNHEHGFKIEGDKEELLKYRCSYLKNKYNVINPSELRTKAIILELLLSKNKIYPIYFQEKFYISRTTFENEIKRAKKLLHNNNIRLKQSDGGYYLQGKETTIRNYASKLLNEIKSFEELNDNRNLYERLGLDTKIIEDSIDSIALKHDRKFEKNEYENLVLHIAIILMRIEQNDYMNLTPDLKSMVKNTQEYVFSKDLINTLSKRKNICFPDDEVVYLTLHILNDDLLLYEYVDKILINNQPISSVTENITLEFLSVAGNILGLDLENDETLKRSLMLHLLPVVYRTELGLNISNPIKQSIKDTYPSLFTITGVINMQFQKYLGILIDDDEVAYITIHIVAAIDRIEDKIAVAVVCHSGTGISNFLSTKIKSRFPKLHIKKIYSTDHPLEIDSEVELIISTIPIEHDIPTIIVTPILSQTDIANIQFYIDQFSKKSLKKLFEEGLINVSDTVKVKEEVLKAMSEQLLIQSYVEKEYYQSILSREKISSTEIGNGVVLTHGFPKKVNESKVSITVLKNPIIWNEEYVDLIVLMSLTQNDIKNNSFKLDWFYKMLNDEKKLKIITSMESSKEIFKYLIENEKKI